MRFSTLRIAWRNLGRNRKRTALALAAIAIGQYALIVATSVYHGFSDEMLKTVTGPFLGDAQVQAKEWRKERAMDLVVGDLGSTVAAIREHPSVESVCPRIFAPSLAAFGEATDMAVVVGVDVAAETGRGGLLEFVVQADRLAGRRALVGSALAKALAAEKGDELAVVGQTADGFLANELYTVVGVISTPVELVNTAGVVTSLAEAQKLFEMPDEAHQITVRAVPGTDEGELSLALASRLSSRPSLAEVEVISWREAVPFIASVIDVLDVAGFFLVGFILIAAIAGITNTMMMSMFERLHEFGMLLGLGCTPRRIVLLIFVEAIVLGALGVIVGTALGLPTVFSMASAGVDLFGVSAEGGGDVAVTGLNFPGLIFPRNEVTDVLVGAIAALLTSMLAAVWPARYAARLEPMDAMRA
jgi:ABC-type lipoprotein release transport system permease subunit